MTTRCSRSASAPKGCIALARTPERPRISGGPDLGRDEAGFSTVAAVEIDAQARPTTAANAEEFFPDLDLARSTMARCLATSPRRRRICCSSGWASGAACLISLNCSGAQPQPGSAGAALGRARRRASGGPTRARDRSDAALMRRRSGGGFPATNPLRRRSRSPQIARNRRRPSGETRKRPIAHRSGH